VVLLTAVAAAPVARALRLAALFAAGQVYDIGANFGGDFLQFRAPYTGPEYPEIGTLDGDNGKTGPARTLADVSTVADKDLAHIILLSIRRARARG
jgi:hypothetical protein